MVQNEFADDLLDALPDRSEFATREEYLAYLCATVRKSKEEVRRAKHLNDNLIRITRERANQQRNLHPKKEHDGYIVLYSQQWQDRDGNGQMVKVWKSLLQTPYDAGISYTSLLDTIRKDLYPVMADLGIHQKHDEEHNGAYPVFDGDTPQNILYRWSYRANFRAGLWEMEIYTTDSLSVSADRQPARNQQGNLRKDEGK
ncbi:MAG: hypothetical protein LUE92_14780 [Clostridiales bacterium]|nr:hypothetical protein [Clostridiales bacterium]